MSGEWSSTAERRRAVLKAARDEFAAKGYGGASVREIARQCGLHQPSLYHLFNGKDRLFRAVIEDGHRELLRFQTERIRSAGSLGEEIHSIFRTLRDFQREHPSHMYLMFALVFAAPDPLQEEYARVLGRDHFGMLRAAFARRGLRDPRRIGLLYDLLRAYMLDLATPAARRGKQVHKRAAVDFILEGTEETSADS